MSFKVLICVVAVVFATIVAQNTVAAPPGIGPKPNVNPMSFTTFYVNEEITLNRHNAIEINNFTMARFSNGSKLLMFTIQPTERLSADHYDISNFQYAIIKVIREPKGNEMISHDKVIGVRNPAVKILNPGTVIQEKILLPPGSDYFSIDWFIDHAPAADYDWSWHNLLRLNVNRLYVG